MATYYYSTGELHSYQNEKENLKHGECRWFYKNGFPRSVGEYIEDEPVGTFTFYEENDSAVVDYIGEYKNGKEICSYSVLSDGSRLYHTVEVNPEFKGGTKKMYDYLGENIRYPQKAWQQNISGKVFIQFTVTKKGDVVDVKVIKSAHKLLDDEAIRVIESMPKWKPGKLDGEKVDCQYIIPINFTIGNKK